MDEGGGFQEQEALIWLTALLGNAPSPHCQWREARCILRRRALNFYAVAAERTICRLKNGLSAEFVR